MKPTPKYRINHNLGDVISLLSCTIGCIHIALIVSSGFTLWPVTPLEILGGLFGTVGMLIYLILVQITWILFGLLIGFLATTINIWRTLGLF